MENQNATNQPEKTDYEKNFDEFWQDIVCNENGEIDLDKVKRELSDYYIAIQEVSKVYYELTDGKFTKFNTDSIHVIAAAQDYFERLYSPRNNDE
jgi:hypothetical protein